MENLHKERLNYTKGQLLEHEANTDPLLQFQHWYDEARNQPDIREANAMAVSTTEADGCPRTRMVLLKSFSTEGFVFYTNYNSRKGEALSQNPAGCLHFFWPSLERQVIIKAKISKTSAETSDSYFRERPAGSKLGAVVSPQSAVIPNREFLENRLQQLEEEYKNGEPQRPEHWGGYLAAPYEIEFWQGRPNRLHDRLQYTLTNGSWQMTRLAP